MSYIVFQSKLFDPKFDYNLCMALGELKRVRQEVN
jgi:hypothetical protein